MPRRLSLFALILAIMAMPALTITPPVFAKSLGDLGLNNDEAAAIKKMTNKQRQNKQREQRNNRAKNTSKNVDETRTAQPQKAKAKKPKTRAHRNTRQKAPSNESGQGVND